MRKSGPEKLYDSVRVNSFPHLNKDGIIEWNEKRYTIGNTLRWDLYYNQLCNLETYVKSLRWNSGVSWGDVSITLQRIYKHRTFFLKRLVICGIIDPLLYNVVGSGREGQPGLPLCDWHNLYIRHARELKIHGKRIFIPELILKCDIR